MPQRPQNRQASALEIATLGRSGLNITDPDDKYTLKSLPGKFSGLRLLAITYTAFRQIDPTMDTGADFSAEFKAATEVQSKSGAGPHDLVGRPSAILLRAPASELSSDAFAPDPKR